MLKALLVSILVEMDRILFSLHGKESITGSQGDDAEIQEPLAPHSKFHLSHTTNILSLGLMESAKTLRKQHRSSSLSFSGLLLSIWHCAQGALLSFLRERHPWVSLSLLLSVSFPAGEQWSRWLVSTAFLQQGKICNFTTSKDFTS